MYLALMYIFYFTLRECSGYIIHQCLKSLLYFACIRTLHLADQTVPFTELAFEMLGGSKTAELTVDHYHKSRTQCFTFFHAVKQPIVTNNTSVCEQGHRRTRRHDVYVKNIREQSPTQAICMRTFS